MDNMLNQPTEPPRLSRTKGFILASLAAGGMAVPFFISGPWAQAQNEHPEQSQGLLGAWNVQVSLDPNSVPPGTPLTFMAVETFSAGGGYVQSNTGPGAGGPPGQGNWVQTGHHKVVATQLRLGFDAAHHFTGVNKIRESFVFNEAGDEFTGNSQVDIFLPDGTLLPIHPAASYHGTRIPIEPLN